LTKTQYKLTCGYLPHEEQCDRRGNCEGCEFAEPVKETHPCGGTSVPNCDCCSLDGQNHGGEDCPYTETAPLICRYGLENCHCAVGQCQHYKEGTFCQKPFSACDTCGRDCKSKQLPGDPDCWVRGCNCGSGEPAQICTAGSEWCG